MELPADSLTPRGSLGCSLLSKDAGKKRVGVTGLSAHLTGQGRHDVIPLAGTNARVTGRIFIDQKEPEHAPDTANAAWGNKEQVKAWLRSCGHTAREAVPSAGLVLDANTQAGKELQPGDRITGQDPEGWSTANARDSPTEQARCCNQARTTISLCREKWTNSMAPATKSPASEPGAERLDMKDLTKDVEDIGPPQALADEPGHKVSEEGPEGAS